MHLCPFPPSIRTRRGWRACPSSSTGMWGPYSAGSGSGATRRSPAPWPASAKACEPKGAAHPQTSALYFPPCVPAIVLLHFQFLRRFSVGLPVTDKTFSASLLSFEKLILIRSSLAQPWPSSKRRPSGHRASTALFKLKLDACLLIFILYGNDW